jgi:hypothetical protein
MNHHWHHNTCTRCGITRKKKPAKVIQLHLSIDRRGSLQEDAKMKTIQLWHYDGYGVNRPDCPDELKVA